MTWITDMDHIMKEIGGRYTFSRNCHSGIASFVSEGHQCGCHRCRNTRGEPWDEATEEQAERDSAEAQRAFRAWVRAQDEAREAPDA